LFFWDFVFAFGIGDVICGWRKVRRLLRSRHIRHSILIHTETLQSMSSWTCEGSHSIGIIVVDVINGEQLTVNSICLRH